MATAKKKASKKAIKKTGGEQSQLARPMNPFEAMDRLFESYFPRGWMRPFHIEWPSVGELASPFEGKMPSVDVIERKNQVIVKAAMPGVEKKDIDVSVTKNSVTIKGSTSHEKKEEKEDYYHSEISRGAYCRTMVLPAEVDESKAKAKFKDGILELTLPKLKAGKEGRRSVKVE